VRPRRWPRYLLYGVIVFLTLAILATAGGYIYLRWRFSQIKKQQIANLFPEGDVMNVLLVGSDSRANVTGEQAQETGKNLVVGQRSDTLMVLHADNKGGKPAILSIPRDLYLPVAGTGGSNRVNTAFDGSEAGTQRLIDTVQNSLGIRINHYVAVDFVGFQAIVNAVGGVNIYVPSPVRDTVSGLSVKTPGCINLTGFQALAWVRSRHFEQYEAGRWKSDPTGDLGRIQRQQDFIRRMLKKALASKNPFRLNQLVGIGIKNVIIDDSMSTGDIFHLARQFRSLNPDAVDMLTLPTTPFGTRIGGQNAAVLRLKQPDAQGFIDRVNSAGPPAGSAAGAVPNVRPDTVRVRVLNGTGAGGLAANVSVALHDVGFNVADRGDADAFKYSHTIIRYGSGGLEKAQLLQSYISGGAQLQADPTLRTVDVAVVVGSDYSGVRSSPSAPGATPTTVAKPSPTPAAKGVAPSIPPC
jgi:LCP family protein required for cell wall assembly